MEDIQLDPAITSGEDIGKGRRGIDWDRVERTLKFEHDTKTQASRQRGRATFNQLISQGVPYAEALRQAGDSGLFEEDSTGWQRMQQHVADMKQKESLNPQHFIHEPGRGIWVTDPKKGTATQIQDFGGTGNSQKAQDAVLRNLNTIIKEAPDSEEAKVAKVQRRGILTQIGSKIPGMAVTTNTTPEGTGLFGTGAFKSAPVTTYAPANISAPAPLPESPISAPAQSAGPATISTKEQFDALEPGAIYLDKSGRRRRKP